MFCIGLLITVAGFLGDKAENLPWVLRLLAPSYIRASSGLHLLESSGSLVPADPGFAELERIFRAETEAKGVAAQLSGKPVEKFVRKAAMIVVGEASAGEVVPVEIILRDTKVDWHMGGLRERVEVLRHRRLLRFSVVLFVAGLAITVLWKDH